MSGLPGVSILICTRNRAAALAPCLDAVAVAMRASKAPSELVLVDNGSTDDTKTVAEHWAAQASLPFRLVSEPRPGLSRARNAGLRATTYDVIAMTDDDCRPHPDFVTRVAECFEQDPTPRMIGGRVELGDQADLPITIKTDAAPRRYASGSRPGGFVMGANLVLHRALVERVGDFDPRFGAGAAFKAAEDSDYILRADLAGFAVEYAPQLVVDHFHGRREITDAVALSRNYYFGDGALYAKHLFRSRLSERMIRSAINNAAHERRHGASTHPILGAEEHRFKLRHMAEGFAAFVKAKAFGGA